MVKRNIGYLPFAFLLIVSVSCSSVNRAAKGRQYFKADSLSAVWSRDTLGNGLIHYSFNGYYQPFNSSQVVHVLDVDLNNSNYKLSFNDSRPGDSLSSVVKGVPGAVAAVNGTYYEILTNKKLKADSIYSSFFKTDHIVKSSVTVPPGHQLFWKHEGAFYYDTGKKKSGIIYGDSDLYNKLPYPNVISGSPMLIFDYKPVGEDFVKPRDKPLDSLHYEDPDRHQGVRHPRTAIARTADNRILLITVDGRAEKAAGMSAKELTQFIKTYFNPKDALNLDGGGSTTMWIKGSSQSSTGVVNYPTDNKRFDHYGQRMIRNSIIVTLK